MNAENINKPTPLLTTLVVPLDWGLGHIMRCIPVIKALQEKGISVIVATDNRGKIIFENEFTGIKILDLKGYNVTYATSRALFVWKLLLQFPRIKSVIKCENAWLAKQVAKHKIDLVISDNRFGLYHSKIPCVFITHQLHIETGIKWVNKLAQKINYNYINKFSRCWVPDNKGMNAVSGKLSQPVNMPAIPVEYIGLLSRFTKKAIVAEEYAIMMLLSGPEPQRTILEKIFMDAATRSEKKILLVRGVPGNDAEISTTRQGLEIVNFLPADELNHKILASGIVICRAGYSTIMDLIVLQKKAILIPTPGQKEQEYLGKRSMQKGWFYSCEQTGFNLEDALEKSGNYQPPEMENNLHLNTVISTFTRQSC